MAKKIKVLMVPAGSGIAVAAISALLQDKNIKIISADSDILAAGLHLADKGYIIPGFLDKTFLPAIDAIVKKEKIDVIIPALDTILLEFSELKPYFENQGVKVLVCDPETIKITRDKWKTYTALLGIVPLPKSFIDKQEIDVPFPLFMKPRGGSGSKGIHVINSAEDLDFYYKKTENPIIQEYLPGREYTVDCLADRNGKLLATICRERLQITNGITTKGRIVKNTQIEKIAKKVSSHLKFSGPFFFQAKEDAAKKPKLIEINARMAGTMSLSSHSGVNIHALAVKMIMGKKITIGKIKYGMQVTRYFKDIYLPDKKNNHILHV